MDLMSDTSNRILQVESNAGTGKTYLVEAYVQAGLRTKPEGGMPKTLITAFNTANALQYNKFLVKELGMRRKAVSRTESLTVKAMTFHSLGGKLLGKNLKYGQFVDNSELIDHNKRSEVFKLHDMQKAIAAYQLVKGMYGQMLLNGKVTVPRIETLLNEQGIEFRDTANSEAAALFSDLLKSVVKGKTRKSVTDMLFLSGLPEYAVAKAEKYDEIIVDEQQDLNPTQVSILLAHSHENTRILFVGDSKQRVNGFQGGLGLDVLSDMVTPYFGEVRKVGLRETFRNSQAIIGYSNAFFAGLGGKWDIGGQTLRQGGTVELGCSIEAKLNMATSNPSDLAVIAYANKDLLDVIGTCLAMGIKPVYTAINDKERKALFEAVCKLLSQYNCGLDDLEDNLTKIVKKLLKNPFKTRSQVRDQAPYKVNSMALAFVRAFRQNGIETITDMVSAIQGMDGLDKSVTLTTIHKAKGMTYGNTILVNLTALGNLALTDKTDTPKCLAYVALTRAKHGLYICGTNANTFGQLVTEAQAMQDDEG